MEKEKSGFTIIELMLVLGLTGLLLIGLLAGTFSSISRQRYNDSLRSFAEYLRNVYSEVISPQSLGQGNSGTYAVLGKVLVFGYDYGDQRTRYVHSATLVGSAKLPQGVSNNFVADINSGTGAYLYCGQSIGGHTGASTAGVYNPLWEAEIKQVNDPAHTPALSFANNFTGTVIIARSPSSGAVHTVYSTKTFDIANNCRTSDGTQFHNIVVNSLDPDSDYTADERFHTEELGFCIKSENSTVYREVRLAEDARNTSGVNILDANPEGGSNRCE